MSDSRPPEGSVAASLDYAASLLTPTAQAPDSRLRGPVLMLQNMLFRLLRPYWWQQRQVNQHLIGALRQVAQASERAVRAEPHQRASLEAVWKQLEAVWKQMDALRSEAKAKVDRADLQAVTTQLAATSASGTELAQRLYAMPYMLDRSAFSYVDGAKQVLGFRSRRPIEDSEYPGFEDIFRGSEAFIQGRQRVYLPILTGRDRVIDIGCGRGEMLDLLREAGIPATGVDINAEMVARCQAKGHAVEHSDGISYLSNLPDASVRAIFAAQVVEHLSFDNFMAFLRVSRSKLAPGGRLVFETPNPHALEAFKTFWTDLTHQRPIFPEVAIAWCWLLGFAQARVLFPNGTGDFEADRIRQGEYAVVATTALQEEAR